MDTHTPNEADPGKPVTSHPQAGPMPRNPETTQAIFDRIMKVLAETGDDPDRLAQAFAVITAETFGGLCSISLLNQHNEMMHIAGLHDFDPHALAMIEDMVAATADIPRDKGVAASVILSGQPILVKTIPEESLKAVTIPAMLRYMDEVGVESIMAIPLKGRSGSIGALSVTRHRGDTPFDEDDLALLNSIGVRISVGLENVLLISSLRAQVAASSSVQDALSASEQRFRSIFESSALGIEIMDPVGTIIDINKTFETLSGFSRSDLVGRPYGTLQHPDDAGPFFQMLTELRMNRDAAPPVENRIIRRDGSTAWVRTNLAAVKKSAGDDTISFIVALHENIGSRKQAECHFQAVLEATPDALVMVNSEGRITLVNRQMERLFGFERDEVLGQDVEMLIPERLRERHPLHRGGYLEEPHVRPMGAGLELFALAKDGTEIPVEISLSPLQMEGEVVVVAAIRDISERKQRQAALVRSERNLAEAQRVAHLGSLEFDIITRSLNASDEALRIFDIPREDLAGSETITARMHPEDRQKVLDATQAVIQGKGSREIEFRVVHRDGSIRIVHDRIAPYFDQQSQATRILGTVQDVTEQRQAENEVTELKSHLQSSAELERLRLAQDLHDGPMQDLYGASFRLDELNQAADPVLQVALEEVNTQIQDTINELRTIAKELRPPAISNFGLEKAIRSYVEDFQVKYPHINLDLSLAQDRQLLPEHMRLTLFRVFQQALANVLRHAQASEVKVYFTLDAEEARLVVSDNGMGFQVPPNWMTFVRQGHYGLAGAAERVNALGGILLVESQPAASTTITVIIPWTLASRGTAPLRTG